MRNIALVSFESMRKITVGLPIVTVGSRYEDFAGDTSDVGPESTDPSGHGGLAKPKGLRSTIDLGNDAEWQRELEPDEERGPAATYLSDGPFGAQT